MSKTFVMQHNMSTAETQYIAFPHNLGTLDDGSAWQDTLYMVGWSVDVGHMEYVHHMVVYGCPEELDPEMQPYDERDPELERNPRTDDLNCRKWVALWGPGADQYSVPPHVAQPVGPGTPHRAFFVQVTP